MPFDLQIVIAGLSLLCFHPDCGGSATEPVVLLVNATEAKMACDGSMLPRHSASIQFPIEDVKISPRLEYLPAKIDGRDYGVADLSQPLLKNNTLTFTQTPSANGAEKRMGHMPKHVMPDKNNPPDAFGWVAALDSIKYLSLSIEPDDVLATIKIQEGTFKSQDLKKYTNGRYAVWTLSDAKYIKEHKRQFPKSLAGSVVVSDMNPKPKELTVEVVKSDGKETLLTYKRTKGSSGKIDLTILNVPAPSNNSPRELHHFKWYYKLVKWEDGKCPSKLPYPAILTDEEKKDFFAVGNLLCPPVTWGAD